MTGLLEVARVLPRTYAIYRRLVAAARRDRPDVFVAIDFPDFNFLLAERIRRLGVPIVYYISPQLWAWRSGRMKTMRALADRVLVIFPFEEADLQGRRRAGAVGRASAARRDAAAGPEDFLARHGLSTAAADRRAAAGQPPQRGARRSCRISPRRPAYPGPAAASAVRRRPRAAHPRRTARPLRSIDGAPPVVARGHADEVLAIADVALVASGRSPCRRRCTSVRWWWSIASRLSPPARPPVRPRQHLCDGQSGRGAAWSRN